MKAEITRRKNLLDKPLKVDEIQYRYERFDGKMSGISTKVIAKRNDAIAAVVYHTGKHQLIFAKQFRVSTYGKSSGWLTELMAGVIDEGESPEKSLERELEEELGYSAEKTEKIVSFYTAPGYSTEQVHLYYVEVSDASKKSNGGGLEAENENIQAVYYSLDDVKKMIAENGFNDAKTIIGCNYLLNRSIV